MSFDSAIVGYGLSQTFITLFRATVLEAYGFWSIVIAIDALLLFRFFFMTRKERPVEEIGVVVSSDVVDRKQSGEPVGGDGSSIAS